MLTQKLEINALLSLLLINWLLLILVWNYDKSVTWGINRNNISCSSLNYVLTYWYSKLDWLNLIDDRKGNLTWHQTVSLTYSSMSYFSGTFQHKMRPWINGGVLVCMCILFEQHLYSSIYSCHWFACSHTLKSPRFLDILLHAIFPEATLKGSSWWMTNMPEI